MDTDPIGYQHARRLTLAVMPQLPETELSLESCCGHVLSREVISRINVPAFASATKDGYVLGREDISHLAQKGSVNLRCLGSISAGSRKTIRLEPGTTVKIFTGGRIPEQTAAVVPQEHTTCLDNMVRIRANITVTRNILAKGADIVQGMRLARSGDLLTPALVGLLAAAGCARVHVYRKPRVVLLATGDEIALPGENISANQVYASNLLALNAFCARFGLGSRLHIVKDDPRLICQALDAAVEKADAVITIGGSWKSDRDMIPKVLDDLNGKRIYHHLRLIPGKSAGLGIVKSKPVFILPGSPPANMVAFLLLTLPGLNAMQGYSGDIMPVVQARLSRPVTVKPQWTRAIFGRLQPENTGNLFTPYSRKSRLRDMAAANAILVIDENTPQLGAGATVMLNLL